MEKIISIVDAYNDAFLKERDVFKSLIIIHDLMNYLDEQEDLKQILKLFHDVSKKNLELLRDKRVDQYKLGDLGFNDSSKSNDIATWFLVFAPLDLTRQELIRLKNNPERKKEIEKNLGDISLNGDKRLLDISIKSLRVYIVNELNKSNFIAGKQIINLNHDKVNFNFDLIKNKGVLKVNNKEILFTKTPAMAINYFYNQVKLSNGYKDYQDFNKDNSLNLSSDELRRLVADINKRVQKETSNLVKQIIKLEDKKTSTSTNKYRWQIKS